MSDKTSDKMSDKRLLPCPFCGGEGKIFETDLNTFRVICKECTCSLGRYWYYKKEEAIAAWNTRKPMERILERIENEILEELSDSGDDWFTAEQINKVIEIVEAELN